MTALSLGVDIGQSRDATCMCAVRSYRPEVTTVEEFNAVASVRGAPRRRVRVPRQLRHFEIVHLAKLRQGENFVDQAQAIVTTACALAEVEDEEPVIYLDATGIGRPMLDLIRLDCPVQIRGVVFTGADQVTRRGRDLTCPKALLVSTLEAVVKSRPSRLHAPSLDVSDAQVAELAEQLEAFTWELSETGRPKFAGKGSHDDWVSALMLGVFGAEQGSTGGSAFMEFMKRDMAQRNSDPFSGFYSDRYQSQE